MNTATTTVTNIRDRAVRISKWASLLLTGLLMGIGSLAFPGLAEASDFRIEIPDQGYASCNSTQNTLAMTAYAAPNGASQYLSARFSYLDEATGRWTTSNWTNAVLVRQTSYHTGGISQVGYWTVNGFHGHTYQAWIQIARWNGSQWIYDQWVRAGHLTNLQATHTNAHGQAIGNLSTYAAGNCVIH